MAPPRMHPSCGILIRPPCQRVTTRRAFRRQLSSVSASDAAQILTHQFRDGLITRRQILDGNQLQKLSITLGRPQLHPGLDISTRSPPKGTPLPPGYHLVYFTPSDLEAALGPDGTDRTFNSPAPFTRRMWAGGRMRWVKGCGLGVGEEVEERTRLLSAVPKKSRDGNEMVIVEVEKEFWGERGLSIVDQRSWVFRPALESTNAGNAGQSSIPTTLSVGGFQPSSIDHGPVDVDGASHMRRSLRWSPLALFRFSALTFNGHMIHYNESWTRGVEGHPGLVVHGPLNLINIMDYWRDFHSQGGLQAREVSYRALAPIYAEEEYSIQGNEQSDGEGAGGVRVLIQKGGKDCMKAEIAVDQDDR